MKRSSEEQSKVVKQEFNLIEIATERELAVNKLEVIIKAVKEKRREMVDDLILEIFYLMNEVRSATIRLIRAISIWQKSFTKPIRPTIYECDYIVEKVIKYIDFINGSNIRKIFNFQFYRGNALLLPYPNLQNSDPIKVHTSLAKEIKAFAFPNEDDIIFCYQFFINCLPGSFYKERLVPLHKWLVEPWMPRIWVTSSPEPCFLSAAQIAAKIRESRRANLNSSNNNNTNSRNTSSRLRRLSTGTNTTSSTLDNAENNDPSESRPVSSSSNNIGSAATSMMRRRLDLQKKEQHQALIVVGLAELSASDPSQPEGDPHEIIINEDEKLLTTEQRQELRQLDNYYQELEGMFLPTLGRRAVQTIVVGGVRATNNSPQQNKDAQQQRELLYRTNKVVFMQQPQQQSPSLHDQLDNTATKRESFLRTNAQLIARKNRLLQERQAHDDEIKKTLSVSNDHNDEEGDDEEEGESKNRDDGENSTAAGSGGTTTVPTTVASPALKPPSPSSGSRNIHGRKLSPMQRHVSSRHADSRRMSDLTVTFSIGDNNNTPFNSSNPPSHGTGSRQMSRLSSASSQDQQGGRFHSPPLSLSTRGMKEWYQGQQVMLQEQEMQRRTQSLRR